MGSLDHFCTMLHVLAVSVSHRIALCQARHRILPVDMSSRNILRQASNSACGRVEQEYSQPLSPRAMRAGMLELLSCTPPTHSNDQRDLYRVTELTFSVNGSLRFRPGSLGWAWRKPWNPYLIVDKPPVPTAL